VREHPLAADNDPNDHLGVSVVVPFHNEKRVLRRCIDALLSQNFPDNLYEIILVDDASDDGSSEEAEEILKEQCGQLPRISLITVNRVGPSSARNAGVYQAKGELIAFTDVDTIPDRQWIKKLIQPFLENTKVGLVGGRIDGLQLSSDHLNSGLFLRLLECLRYHQEFGPDFFMNEMVGANMAVRKRVFDKVGGFPNLMVTRSEENVVRYRALKKYEEAFAPDAIVKHERPEHPFEWLNMEYRSGLFSRFQEKALRGRALGFMDSVYLVEWFLYLAFPLLMIRFPFFLSVSPAVWIAEGLGLAVWIRRFYRSEFQRIRWRVRADFGSAWPFLPAMGLDWLGTWAQVIGFLAGSWKFANLGDISYEVSGKDIVNVQENIPRQVQETTQ